MLFRSAQLQMKQDLGFSDAMYGLGAAVFYVGYVLCEVPSNMLLARFGARRTFTRIMVLWGLASVGMMLVSQPSHFYWLRFLLGVAEGGFTPSMIFYLTLWFPQNQRGRFIAIFCSAIPIAGIISGPLSGLLLGLDGMGGLHGWQWLFLIEGLPACLLAFAVLKFLA